MSVAVLRTKMAEQNKDQRKWELCAALAEDIFIGAEVISQDKAYAGYALCRSLSNLDRYMAALEPGQVASVLAAEQRDYELLGRTLLELAYVQGLIPGHEFYAIDTLRKFLSYQQHYPNDLQAQVSDVLYNLAVAERSCGRHEEAIQHFHQAWERTNLAKDASRRDQYRRGYCLQALLIEDLPLAEKLIALGDEYLKMHPQETLSETHLLVDKSRYAYLKGDQSTAIALAMEVVPKADHHNDSGLMANALIIWGLALEKLGELESAMAINLWANIEAQRSMSPEMVAQVQQSLRGIRMQEREVVDRVMVMMLRPAR